MSEKLWRRDGARAWAEAYLVDLSAHGLYRLSATASYLPGVARLLWGLLFVGALAYSLRQCATLFSQYQSNELDVSVDFHFNVETVFPAVTICNLNPLRSTAVLSSRFHKLPTKTNSSTETAVQTVTGASSSFVHTTVVPPRTRISTLSTDKTLDPRALEPTLPPDREMNSTFATTPDPELTETFSAPASTRPQAGPGTEPSILPAFTVRTTAPPITPPPVETQNVSVTTPHVSTDNATDVPTTQTLPATSASDANQTAEGPEEPGDGGGQSSCQIFGFALAPIPGLSCALLKALLTGSGGASAPPLPTFAPKSDDFDTEKFFDTGSSSSGGGGKTATDIILDIADSYDENGTTSVFEHILSQNIVIVGVDTTKHEVNLDYSQTPIVREEMSLLGHQLEDMMISCQWEGAPCDASNFTQFQNGHYGNCYTFNSGKNMTVLKTQHVGPRNGLIVELDLEQAKNYIGQLSHSAGLRVVLHQEGENPYPEEDGFNIPPGHMTYIGIRQVVIERRGEPYSDCRPSTVHAGADRYTKLNCLKMCLAEEMFLTCSCVESTFLELDYPLCHVDLNKTQGECLEGVRRRFTEDEICFTCRDPCRSIIYRKTISMERWPSMAYEYEFERKLLATNKSRFGDDTQGYFRDDYVRFVVYFEEFNYQKINQRPAIELATLLSSIGGTLGLYVGMSVLSIAEFIDMFLNMLYFLWQAVVKRLRKNLPVDAGTK